MSIRCDMAFRAGPVPFLVGSSHRRHVGETQTSKDNVGLSRLSSFVQKWGTPKIGGFPITVIMVIVGWLVGTSSYDRWGMSIYDRSSTNCWGITF